MPPHKEWILMHISRAAVKTEHASRYLQQLCKHWSHKFAVTFNPQEGMVPFNDHTKATFAADDTTLTIVLATSDTDGGTRMQTVIAEHLQRFAFREDLHFSWQSA